MHILYEGKSRRLVIEYSPPQENILDVAMHVSVEYDDLLERFTRQHIGGVFATKNCCAYIAQSDNKKIPGCVSCEKLGNAWLGSRLYILQEQVEFDPLLNPLPSQTPDGFDPDDLVDQLKVRKEPAFNSPYYSPRKLIKDFIPRHSSPEM